MFAYSDKYSDTAIIILNGYSELLSSDTTILHQNRKCFLS